MYPNIWWCFVAVLPHVLHVILLHVLIVGMLSSPHKLCVNFVQCLVLISRVEGRGCAISSVCGASFCSCLVALSVPSLLFASTFYHYCKSSTCTNSKKNSQSICQSVMYKSKLCSSLETQRMNLCRIIAHFHKITIKKNQTAVSAKLLIASIKYPNLTQTFNHILHPNFKNNNIKASL